MKLLKKLVLPMLLIGLVAFAGCDDGGTSDDDAAADSGSTGGDSSVANELGITNPIAFSEIENANFNDLSLSSLNVSCSDNSKGIKRIWKVTKEIKNFWDTVEGLSTTDLKDYDYIFINDSTVTFIIHTDYWSGYNVYYTKPSMTYNYTYDSITGIIQLKDSNNEVVYTYSLENNSKSAYEGSGDRGAISVYLMDAQSTDFSTNNLLYLEDNDDGDDNEYDGTGTNAFKINSLSASYDSSTKELTIDYDINCVESEDVITRIWFTVVSPTGRSKSYERGRRGQVYDISIDPDTPHNSIAGSAKMTFTNDILPENGEWEFFRINVCYNDFSEGNANKQQIWSTEYHGDRTTDYTFYDSNRENVDTTEDVVTFTVSGGVDALPSANMSSISRSGDDFTFTADKTIHGGKVILYFGNNANSNYPSNWGDWELFENTFSNTNSVTVSYYGSYSSKYLLRIDFYHNYLTGNYSDGSDSVWYSGGIRVEYVGFPVDKDLYHNNSSIANLYDLDYFYNTTELHDNGAVKTDVEVIPAW